MCLTADHVRIDIVLREGRYESLGCRTAIHGIGPAVLDICTHVKKPYARYTPPPIREDAV